MLNNKAQALVIFVITLPLVLLFAAYVFDVLSTNYEKSRLNGIAQLVKEDYSCDIVIKNDKDIKCSIDDNSIVLTKRVKSLFGKITNKNYFELKTTIKK